MTVKEIQNGLSDNGYIGGREIAIAVSGAINHNIPLLIEGAPGVGKTSLAKAISSMLDLPLLRVQFYEGLTYDKILYDYDYQKQLTIAKSEADKIQNDLNDLIGQISDVTNLQSLILAIRRFRRLRKMARFRVRLEMFLLPVLRAVTVILHRFLGFPLRLS